MRIPAGGPHASLNEIRLTVGRRRLYLSRGRQVSTAAPPRDLRSEAIHLLETTPLRPAQIAALRGFWSPRGLTRPISDIAYVRALTTAIRHGEVHAAAVAGPVAPSFSPRIAKPSQPPPPGGDVAAWTWVKRLHYVLVRTLEMAPAAMKAGCQDLLSEKNLALMLGGVALVAAANYTPVGWAADAAFFASLLWMVGSLSLAWEVIGDLLHFVARFVKAKSKADLDAASDSLLAAIRVGGPAVVLLLLHAKVKARAGGALPAEDAPVTRAKGVDGGTPVNRAQGGSSNTSSVAGSPLRERYLSESGGRWGGSSTRALNDKIATDLESQGYEVTNGAGRGAEEWIPGPNGGTTGGTFVDLTATMVRTRSVSKP